MGSHRLISYYNIDMMNSLSNQLFQLMVESSPAAMILVDQDGLICFANHAAESLFGYSNGQLPGNPIEILVPQESSQQHQQERAEFYRHPQARSMGSGRFLRARRRDGSQFPAEIGLTPIQLAAGWYTLSLIIDMTIQKQAEDRISLLAMELEQANEQLEQLASTDPLTGLFNRRVFDEQLKAQIRLMKRMSKPLSLLVIDLDGFKQYNDRHGHLAGDQVLKTMARLFSQNMRTSDIIARFGGEEFVAILPDTTGPAALQLAERMRLAVRAHAWENDGITISLGAATLTFTETSSAQEPGERTRLFSEADQALYHSKSSGRDRVTHYDELNRPEGGGLRLPKQ
jgi:diguanylate cyclase (GGDEF)-like protein/PAS domain S-box-containing protein